MKTYTTEEVIKILNDVRGSVDQYWGDYDGPSTWAWDDAVKAVHKKIDLMIAQFRKESPND